MGRNGTYWKRGIAGSVRRHFAAAFVWLVAVAACGWLIDRRASGGSMRGLAVADQCMIAADRPGRLSHVAVELFAHVHRGQTVAVLMDDLVAARLATAGADLARIRADLTAAEAQPHLNTHGSQPQTSADARRVAVEVEELRVRELEVNIDLESHRVRLQRLRFEQDRQQSLHETGSTASDELQRTTTEHDALLAQIIQSETLLAELRRDIQDAQVRLASHLTAQPRPSNVDTDLGLLRAAITVQERRVDELAVERAALVLTSPVDGFVRDIFRRGGEAVLAGESIVSICKDRPSHVDAYATNALWSRLEHGQRVRLVVPRTGGHTPATIASIGPAMALVPQRLWRQPTVPEWAWPVRVSIPVDANLMPDEVVSVSSRRW